MIRLLHIITRLDMGGSAETVVTSVTRMPRAKYSCSLISGPTLDPPPGLEETLARADVPWIRLAHLGRAVRPLADGVALWELIQAIRRIGPDIVHTHTSKAGFLGRLAARALGVPHIVHTPHGHIFHGYFSPTATRMFAALERLAAPWTDRILTLSDAEAADHLRRRIGRPDQFVTIPSGVEIESVRPAPPTRVVSGRPLVGTVARLVPVKGLQYLIEAAPGILRRYPGARFLLVGEGKMRSTLEAQARSLGLDGRLVFAGFRKDAPALIAGMDVFVLPSINEGMGRVLVMAMALGKPIVATHVGGVGELVGSGEAGLLVPPRDPKALADAVIALLDDPARAAALAEAGRRRAFRYSAEVMLESLGTLYREVMSVDRR